MKSLSKYSDVILKLSEFVKQLEPSVRQEAFKFLLAQEFNQLLEQPGNTKAPPIQREGEPQPRAMAPQELLRKCGVASLTKKAVVLAYWLEKYQAKPSFSSSDIKLAFEQAREKSPKNASDLVAQLEATARIMKADKVGAAQHYHLTSTAIADVESLLNTKSTEK